MATQIFLLIFTLNLGEESTPFWGNIFQRLVETTNQLHCWGQKVFLPEKKGSKLVGKMQTYRNPVGGGFKYFYFPPYLGKWSKMTNIFQMGWNHQLETFRRIHFLPTNIAIKKIRRNPKAGKAIVSLSNPKFQVEVVSFGGVVCVPSFGWFVWCMYIAQQPVCWSLNLNGDMKFIYAYSMVILYHWYISLICIYIYILYAYVRVIISLLLRFLKLCELQIRSTISGDLFHVRPWHLGFYKITLHIQTPAEKVSWHPKYIKDIIKTPQEIFGCLGLFNFL